jgi:hypothetical protein
MSKHPVSRVKNLPAVREARAPTIEDEGRAPAIHHERGRDVTTSTNVLPGVSFRYSYTEIAAHGPVASVRHRRVRFKDGKLAQESFEGTVDVRELAAAVSKAQAELMQQTQHVLRSLFWFLPAPMTRSLEDRDEHDMDRDR